MELTKNQIVEHIDNHIKFKSMKHLSRRTKEEVVDLYEQGLRAGLYPPVKE